MINSDFASYLSEYEAVGIGHELYKLIYTAVAQTIKSYPPSVYSPNGVWDEDAISGLCHDFTMQKLLLDGWLEYYLFSLNTVEGLIKVIKHVFRHFLINKKVRTEKSNLFIRVKTILQTDSKFQPFTKAKANASIWGLVGWEEKDVVQDLDELLQALTSIDLPPLVRYRPDSLKLSPFLKNPDLTRMIQLTLQKLDKRVPLNLLIEGLCYRLGIISEVVISLDDPLNSDPEDERKLVDVIPDSSNTEAELSSQETAENIFEQLTDRQRQVLELHFELSNPTLEDIGRHIGMSKSTVSNEMTAITKVIAGNISYGDETDRIIPYLKSLCVSHLR